MGMLEGNGPAQLPGATEVTPEQKQRRVMLAALALLLIALILVLIKDRQFWFPDNESADETPIQQPDDANPQDHALTYNAKAEPPAPARVKAKSHPPAAPVPSLTEATAPVVNRTALPPLDIEVVAGDQRQPVKTVNPSMKVDMQTGSPPVSPAPVVASASVSSAGERVRLSSTTQQLVTHSVEPTYPTLAKQMKVQGSVVLQALIGKEGTIQDLQVLSGPQILSSAAREAVMQWRFKPYLQSGQAIETEAKITVNFTISTY
ncbi:MAG TPA: TonB family protein [Terriglobales bacterium]|nr:TonB family protein [Terriglobales bacterium]